MKLNKKNIIAITISILFLFLTFKDIDIAKLISTFAQFNTKLFLVFIPIFLISMFLRGLRWKYLLKNTKEIHPVELGEIFSAGAALNIYLPARAGDLYRAYFVGEKHEKPKLEILASVIAERIIDGITVLGILLSATLLFYKKQWMFELSAMTALIFIGSSIAIYLVIKYNKSDQIFRTIQSTFEKLPQKIASNCLNIINKLEHWTKTFIKGFENILILKNLLSAGALSIIIWIMECIMIYIIIVGFNLYLPFSVSLMIVSFVALASMIPSTSIYIGPYQYAFILALGIYNIDKSSALAIAFTLQTITLIILSIIFINFVIRNNFQVNQLKKGDITKGLVNE